MARRLIRVELWSDLVSAGGQALGAIPKRSVQTSFAIEGTGQRCVVTAPRRAAILAQATPRRVLRLIFADGRFEEWRIQRRTRTVGNANLVTLTALSLDQTDLAEGNIIATTDTATGLLVAGGGAAGLTAQQYLDAYVVPALAAVGLGMYARGTVVPTVAFDLSWDDTPTPLDFLNRIRDAVRARGVGCEWRLRQNGTAGYYIDLLTAIGADAPTIPLRLGGRLGLPAEHEEDATEQVTRVITYGKDRATMAHARWLVTAVDPVTKRVTLADPAGGAGPIAFDEECVGWYLYREATGGTFQVLHTWAATQQVELPAVGTLAAGEMVAWRLAEPRAGALVLPLGTSEYARVTGVAGAAVTLDGAFASGVDPLTADGQCTDRELEWFPLQVAALQITLSTNIGTTGGTRCPVASSAGVHVGDLAFISTSVALPATGLVPWGRVVGVDVAAANELEIVVRSTGAPLGATGGPFRAWIYRPQAAGTYRTVRDSVAATNTCTLDAAGPPVDAAVQVIQRAGTGARPFMLRHPTRDLPPSAGGYGPKLGRADRPLLTGLANRLPNPFMRTWTTPTSPPDGWAKGAAITGSRITDPLYTRRGGASYRCTWAYPGSGTTLTVLEAPLVRFVPAVAGTRASARLSLFIESSTGAAWSGDQRLTLTLVGVGATLAGATASCYPPDHPSAPDEQKVAAGQWIDLAVENLDVGVAGLTGILLQLSWTNAAGVVPPVSVIVDAGVAYEGDTAPAELVEFNDPNALWQSANRVLDQLSAPPFSLSLTLTELQTINPAITAADVVLGGMVRPIIGELALDTLARVQTLDYQDWPRTARSPAITVATRPPLFTDVVDLT